MLLAQRKARNICVKSFPSSGKGWALPRAALGLKGWRWQEGGAGRVPARLWVRPLRPHAR